MRIPLCLQRGFIKRVCLARWCRLAFAAVCIAAVLGAHGCDRVFVGAEEDDNANGTNAGGVFELRLDRPKADPRLIIPADGAPRSYLGFAVATTARDLAASEDAEVRLFPLDATGTADGRKLSTLLGAPLPSGVLALAGHGRYLVVGMPFADAPETNTGVVTVVALTP